MTATSLAQDSLFGDAENPQISYDEINQLIGSASPLLEQIAKMDFDSKVYAINQLRLAIKEYSPFSAEPIDCVQWVKTDFVAANNYNPNTVAPPEMELLRLSIISDGYTQPVVGWFDENGYEVIDGFHRTRVGKECADVRERVHGYIPLVEIKEDREGRNDRMASTIRHNRARGKHGVDSMSDIVVELKRRNWSDEKIMRELGMDQDEILRLFQITGMQELFSDQEFSASWDVEGEISEDDFVDLTDDYESFDDDVKAVRTVNTSDPDRVFHTYEKWECYKAGFYATTKEGMKKDECQEAYREFLSDIDLFSETLGKVITEWPHSCEHYLTNVAMNRIAWLGQASACYALGIPSTFRGGFSLLTPKEQDKANLIALDYLNRWLESTGREPVTLDKALSGDRQSEIY